MLKKFRGKMPLEDYLAQYAGKLNPISVTSLMMPLALELRDKHLNGELSIRLSSKGIIVTEKGCALTDKIDDDSYVQQTFLAPEQLSHSKVGVYTDIYAFCVLLDYMLSFAPPEIRDSSAACEWIQLVGKGLAEEPAQRYATMQELIFALSPYNGGITRELFSWDTAAQPSYAPPVPAYSTGNSAYQPCPAPIPGVEKRQAVASNQPHAPEKLQKRQKKKRSPLVKVCVIAAAVIVTVLIYGGVNYIGARINIGAHHFESADRFLKNMLVAGALFPRDRSYVDAGLKLDEKEFDAAVSAFSALGDFSDAEEMVKESMYQKAADEADEDNYDAAVSLYRELGAYKDSATLAGDTICTKGYSLIDAKAYKEAIETFKQLEGTDYEDYSDIILDAYYTCARSLLDVHDYYAAYDYLTSASGYKDTNELLKTVTEKLYERAVDLYQGEFYEQASDYLHKLGNYMSAADYIVLCNAHNDTSSLSEDIIWSKLVPLIGFEDATELILKDYATATIFLAGEWKGDGYSFTMEESGQIYTDVPYKTFGDGSNIFYGLFYLIDSDTQETKSIWLITPVSMNCIDIYSADYDDVYTLYRQ